MSDFIYLLANLICFNPYRTMVMLISDSLLGRAGEQLMALPEGRTLEVTCFMDRRNGLSNPRKLGARSDFQFSELLARFSDYKVKCKITPTIERCVFALLIVSIVKTSEHSPLGRGSPRAIRTSMANHNQEVAERERKVARARKNYP